MSYLTIVEGGYTPHTLSAAFRMHEQFQLTGDMRGVILGRSYGCRGVNGTAGRCEEMGASADKGLIGRVFYAP